MVREPEGFHPVRISRTSTEIIKQIISMMDGKRLRAGDRLPSEHELTRLLETSRPTLREALSALKALGLVQSAPGKGTYVTEGINKNNLLGRLSLDISTQQEFLEAHEARLAIECQICWLASRRAKKADLDKIRRALDSMDQADTAEAFRRADYDFHISLAYASKNSLFVSFVEDVYRTLTVYYWQILERAGRTSDSISKTDHGRIYEALEKRDQKLSRDVMATHLDKIRDNFLSSFSSLYPQGTTR